jgi:hypothetical protein
MPHCFRLTDLQTARLRKLVALYKPRMGKSWKRRSPDQLWLRVLSQVVVAGNAAPGYTLQYAPGVRERLGYSELKKLPPRIRRCRIHSVLKAIGTRYVGKKPRNRKVDAALHNFDVLVSAGGPNKFFLQVAAKKTTEAKIDFLADRLKYYKKKGCRDILIELRLASDCMALDQRLKNILIAIGGTISGSVDRQYEQIERELVERVAKPSGLSGGELDRILFQNYPDLMVRLLCP